MVSTAKRVLFGSSATPTRVERNERLAIRSLSMLILHVSVKGGI